MFFIINLCHLKKLFLLSLVIFFLTNTVSSQNSFPAVDNNVFQQGEYLKFFIYYGWLDAGEASLEVSKELKVVSNHSCYVINGKGYSIGFFEWFFKVNDYYLTYLDKSSLLPLESYRNVDEGGYVAKDHFVFNHELDFVISENKRFKVPDNSLEIISAIYYARCIDYSETKAGTRILTSNYVMEDVVYPLELEYIGKEIITTGLGSFSCYAIKPLLQEGRVFNGQKGMTIWITDDANKLPVRVQTDILVGAMKMDLIDYANLKHPIKKIK